MLSVFAYNIVVRIRLMLISNHGTHAVSCLHDGHAPNSTCYDCPELRIAQNGVDTLNCTNSIAGATCIVGCQLGFTPQASEFACTRDPISGIAGWVGVEPVCGMWPHCDACCGVVKRQPAVSPLRFPSVGSKGRSCCHGCVHRLLSTLCAYGSQKSRHGLCPEATSPGRTWHGMFTIFLAVRPLKL